jgi:two-component system, NarL family, nitrate/nitrite response regulator NarL
VSKSTTSVIVTPRVVLREGITALLQDTCYKVVAGASEPAELPPACGPKGKRTLAIVGVGRQNGNLNQTAENVRLLRSLMPQGKVVLVIETAGPIDLQRLLALSPDACIFELGSRDTLIKVLELVFAGHRLVVFGNSISATIGSDAECASVVPGLQSSNSRNSGTTTDSRLSSRECQVLSYLAQGRSNKAIARLCNVSEATVKVHLRAILRKTNTQNRTQAAIWAIEHGLRDNFAELSGSAAPVPPMLSPAGAVPTAAVGHHRTLRLVEGMSALPPKADID